MLVEALDRVSDVVVDEARKLRSRREELTAAQRLLADTALANAPVVGTGGAAWKLLWQAARNFAAATGSEFPDTSDLARCGLCQQTLDDDARMRFAAFDRFVSNDIEADLAKARDEADALVRAAPDPVTLRAKLEATLLAVEDEQVDAEAERALITYAARRAALSALGSRSEGHPESPPVPDFPAFAAFIDARREAEAAHSALDGTEKQQEVLKRLAELRDRASLSDHINVVLDYASRLRRRKRIGEALRVLDTKKISLAQRKLGARVITDELRDALSVELSALTPTPPRVTIAGSVRKGQMVIRLELDAVGGHSVAEVLSDGEQRALSTAFFLAELRVASNRSAIVLDDPVTSLDQTRREYVARRIVEEARHRQVIVFTHDLAFLLLLQAEARELDLPCHGQTLLRAGGRIGLTRDELPFEGQSPQKRLRVLRGQLDGLHKLYQQGHFGYEAEAELWCVRLRQTWEQTIEDIVLAGVVRRFRPSIEPSRLRDVVLDAEIRARVERAMRTTSPWAHFRSPEFGLPARSPEQLSAMAHELAELHELLDPNKRSRLRALPPDAHARETG